MKHMTISPSAASFFHNEEAAPVGEALQAVNLRRRCKSVEVVGNPENVGNVPTGHRIICIHSDGGYVTTHGGLQTPLSLCSHFSELRKFQGRGAARPLGDHGQLRPRDRR